MHIIGFTTRKDLETCSCFEFRKIRLTNAKTSFSLRLNAFFSKNVVESANTR